MQSLTPKEIVAELDKYIVGQADAKRAVAVAVRNRWWRQQLPEQMKQDVSPKNILMVRTEMTEAVKAPAEEHVEDRLLDYLLPHAETSEDLDDDETKARRQRT